MNRRKKKFIVVSLISGVVLALIAVVLLKIFFIWIVRVPTLNMANTIIPGDSIVATKIMSEPGRGDIVLFHVPNKNESYVSRVIGLPGDTVQVKGQHVYINGQPLAETRVTIRVDEKDFHKIEELGVEGSGAYRVYYQHAHDVPEDDDFPFAGTEPLQLDQSSYFLMGDNRDNSEDSRYYGPVKSDAIWAKARSIIYSEHPRTKEERSDRMFKKLE